MAVGLSVTPTLHPHLVNGRSGDPALFVERLHRREALLFDCGDLTALSNRDLLRVHHLFVSHLHMDHWIGFDRLLRVHIGRDKLIRVVGPHGLIERLHHRLQGYEWDLTERYNADLVFVATEAGAAGPERSAQFRFLARFAVEPLPAPEPLAADDLAVTSALLEHHGPCLGFAVAERAHANVWKVRLAERGLAPGPWLQALKSAVLAGAPDGMPIELSDKSRLPLAALRDLVTVGPGQRLAYVTDVADTPANRTAITALAHGADLLFLEARFATNHATEAAARAHLTTAACGEIGRAAGVRRLEPFHFSPRYDGEEDRMLAEVAAAFAGAPVV
ncbi:MBL fold metallo-hydrolase [Sphingomonas sp. BN140010]|uniref:MBL fold metallo-hydrolase n=1 Tax=Sphingomonas arvum TaxID=2992113 RepID=A0ABT3JGL2_9SPHN|nr:MBL fold metallo-hydrolase [Sphingomonas sp. BN140010]MCW3798193.1 MBL fold metallo-hydrolase [Sphingomonas sp. BN140010]